MPTYEYACSNCDTTHEVQQKMTDPTLTECPSCGQSTLRKLFSGVGIHFKGSGFYRTDSRDSKSSAAAVGQLVQRQLVQRQLVQRQLVVGLGVVRLVGILLRQLVQRQLVRQQLDLLEHPGGQPSS